MLKVKIKLEHENGKSAEIEITEANKLDKLLIIQNVFNLFGIDTDIMQMTKTFKEIGLAYESFFKEVDNIESTEEVDRKNVIRQRLIDGFANSKDELQNIYQTDEDQPEYIKTGIKTDLDGTKRYKLRYKCPECKHSGNHYIYPDSTKTWCHHCHHEMIVLLAGKRYMERDTFGNFFRAGDYKDWNVIND